MTISVISLCCLNDGYPFVVPVNKRNPMQLMSEGNKPNEPTFYLSISLMNYPYSSLVFETQRAKQQLARSFSRLPDRCVASISQPDVRPAPAENHRPEIGNRSKVSKGDARLFDRLGERCGVLRFPNSTYWMREDMRPLSFTLTLMFLGTWAAMQTEQPLFWLLAGPLPLAVGYAGVRLARRKCHLGAWLRGFRNRVSQRRETLPDLRSCPCQWQ